MSNRSDTPSHPSRRAFVTDVGRLATAVALTGCAAQRTAEAAAVPDSHSPLSERPSLGEFDLSWVARLAGVANRAVFDSPSMEEPPESTALDEAARYMDNVATVYGATAPVRVVLVLRASALPIALTDEAWAQYGLGAMLNVKDPVTGAPATRNPFWRETPGPTPALTPPSLQDIVQRGAIVLACDFALTHLARRLAQKLGQDADALHGDLRRQLVPNGFAVPSGIFGVIRAQNAGCAYMRA